MSDEPQSVADLVLCLLRTRPGSMRVVDIQSYLPRGTTAYEIELAATALVASGKIEEVAGMPQEPGLTTTWYGEVTTATATTTATTPASCPRIYELCSIEYALGGKLALAVCLADGWEPYAVTSEPHARRVHHLRRVKE